MIFWVYCIVSLFNCMFLSCPTALHNIFHAPVARYSLFVLKVLLNNNKPNCKSWYHFVAVKCWWWFRKHQWCLLILHCTVRSLTGCIQPSSELSYTPDVSSMRWRSLQLWICRCWQRKMLNCGWLFCWPMGNSPQFSLLFIICWVNIAHVEI